MSHSVVVPAIDASATLTGPSVGKPTSASGSESAPTFVIKVVSHAGVVTATLTDAEADTLTWTLNATDEAEFHFPKNAYTASQLAVIATVSGPREIQIYRNGDLLFWGPIIRLDASGDEGKITCHCAGVDWYLNRRFLDGIIDNTLTNADFESGTGSWTNSGTTFSIDSDTFLTGSQCAKLVGTGGNQYIQQNHNLGPSPIGMLMTASAWFFIDNISDAAFETRGLYVEGSYNGVFQANNYYPIDTATPQGRWVKARTTLFIPPLQRWTIRTRLYAPVGTVHWDDVKLVQMFSVGTTKRVNLGGGVLGPLLPEDLSSIVHIMVRAVQNPTLGKSRLNIGFSGEATGVSLIKVWQDVDHVQFDQALREFVERADGIDYYIKLTPTSRTFRQYAGKRGADRSGSVTLRYDVASPSTSNCVNYRYGADGGGAITRQVILGEDNGPDREQGEAVDTSNLGGVILQDVRQAPQGTDIGSLQPLADERITRFSTVPETIEMQVRGSSGLIPTIHCGDLVAVDIDDGYVDIAGTYRIMRLSLNCVTNILTVTCALDTL